MYFNQTSWCQYKQSSIDSEMFANIKSLLNKLVKWSINYKSICSALTRLITDTTLSQNRHQKLLDHFFDPPHITAP